MPGTSYSGTTGLSINQTAQTGSGNITLDVSPSLLLANGADTSHVTISVRGADSQPAIDGTVVKIVAGEKFVDVDGNGYWSSGIDSLVYDANNNGTWDAYGLIPSTAMTSGGTGIVSIDYISGNDAMTVYIKATVDDNGITGFAELPLQVNPNANVGSIFLNADSVSLVVKQTGGIETALLHAVGYDENGNTVPEGLQIEFIITDGPGGGEHLGNTGTGPYAAVTNSQGIATCPISSGTIPGTIRIRAYADTVLSNATQVLVAAGPPVYIIVGVEDLNVPFWATVNNTQKVTAIVSDFYHNPVPDSTVVYFTTDEGTIKSHESRTMDQNGIATSTWMSGSDQPGDDGDVYITVETAGGTVSYATYFLNTYITDTIVIDPLDLPSSIIADGETKYIFEINGYDLNMNPVDDPTGVNIRSSILGSSVTDFDDDFWDAAIAEVTLTSKTLKVDASTPGGNDDGIGATEYVTIWSGSAARTFAVNLLTGSAYNGNCSLDGTSSVAVGGTGRFTAVINDRYGNPLGDHTLVMTASAGTVVSSTHETNDYGEAGVFVWTAPGTAGDVIITVQDTDPRGQTVYLETKVTVE